MARMFSPMAPALDYEFVISLFGKARGSLPKVHPMPTDAAGTTEPTPPNPRNTIMNAKTLIATALFVSFAGTGAAFAQEGTQDFPVPQLLSSTTRAEVIAELNAAPRSQPAGYGEASTAPMAASQLSRAQVVAETREAMRLGLTETTDGSVRVATPAQLEQIRAAGLRTLDNSLAQAAK